MLTQLQIKNFKSILDDTIELGRVNVFIGENGCGKSNILEALMFASLAEKYSTIDANILYSNGFRVCKPALLLSSFQGKRQAKSIGINLEFIKDKIKIDMVPKSKSILSKWENEFQDENLEKFIELKLKEIEKEELNNIQNEIKKIEFLRNLAKSISNSVETFYNKNEIFKTSPNFTILTNFIIYTLNTEALRGISNSSEILGIHGENLDSMIGEMSSEELAELKELMYSISWIDDFFIDSKDELKMKGLKLNHSKSLLYFRDKFMQKNSNVFSTENSNEGVLHVLFYLANLISSKTPKLFAVDNIETSLNPHLCRHLMEVMCKLTKLKDKQILITTHNPAILDGLNLLDDEIRLFEVFRTDNGDTRTRRIVQKPIAPDGKQLKLSELWTRGYLGAISDHF